MRHSRGPTEAALAHPLLDVLPGVLELRPGVFPWAEARRAFFVTMVGWGALLALSIVSVVLSGSGTCGRGFIGVPLFFAGAAAPMLPVTAMVLWVIGPMRRAWRLRLALDDGGLRLCQGSAASYWPFDLVSGGTIVDGTLTRSPCLELYDLNTRPIVQVSLMGEQRAFEDAQRFLAECMRRKGRTAVGGELFAGLRRRGRPLTAWLSSIQSAVLAAEKLGAYRGEPLDVDGLLAIIDVSGAPDDLRAGAVCALLCSSSDQGLRARVAQRIGAASPPVVIATARQLGGESVVPATWLQSVAAYLDVDDRAELAT